MHVISAADRFVFKRSCIEQAKKRPAKKFYAGLNRYYSRFVHRSGAWVDEVFQQSQIHRSPFIARMNISNVEFSKTDAH